MSCLDLRIRLPESLVSAALVDFSENTLRTSGDLFGFEANEFN
jgi:hypothetical protein